MPVYAYRCESCGVHFERQQSFSETPLKRFPECNKNTLPGSGIALKGLHDKPKRH